MFWENVLVRGAAHSQHSHLHASRFLPQILAKVNTWRLLFGRELFLWQEMCAIDKQQPLPDNHGNAVSFIGRVDQLTYCVFRMIQLKENSVCRANSISCGLVSLEEILLVGLLPASSLSSPVRPIQSAKRMKRKRRRTGPPPRRELLNIVYQELGQRDCTVFLTTNAGRAQTFIASKTLVLSC